MDGVRILGVQTAELEGFWRALDWGVLAEKWEKGRMQRYHGNDQTSQYVRVVCGDTMETIKHHSTSGELLTISTIHSTDVPDALTC